MSTVSYPTASLETLTPQMAATSSAVVSNSDMAVANREIIIEYICMHQMSYEMEFQEEMRKMMNPVNLNKSIEFFELVIHRLNIVWVTIFE